MQNFTEFSSDETSEDPRPSFYSSGMFSGAQNLTVTGHTLINNTSYHTTAPSMTSDVKMVSLWDIDLQHEICLDSSTGVVDWHRSQPSVRRMYSAKIAGQSTTVAMYQGYGAEEEWLQDLAKYRLIRHPNIVQIRGAASSGSIRAALFHDDLIPFKQYLDFYRHSHFLTVYIHGCCDEEFWDVIKYFYSNFQQRLTAKDCTFWIRRSTGRLCADLAKPIVSIWSYNFWSVANTQRVSSWNGPNGEGMIIRNLQLRNYHEICAFHLARDWIATISTQIHVNLGTVVFWPSTDHFEDSAGVAFSPNEEAYQGQWEATGGARGERTEEGWMRFSTSDVFGRTLKLECWRLAIYWESWLTHANHIFSRLHIASNFEDCVVLNSGSFEIKILPTKEEPPTGFLFLCPEEDFRMGPCSFCWPELPARWSLDPSGVERLSAEEATDFGFPSLELTTQISGYSWDNSVYAGIRECHRAKGFDPESQDVARHLGHPLYYSFNELDPPFAHVNEEQEYYSGEDDEDQMVAEGDQMDLSW